MLTREPHNYIADSGTTHVSDSGTAHVADLDPCSDIRVCAIPDYGRLRYEAIRSHPEVYVDLVPLPSPVQFSCIILV